MSETDHFESGIATLSADAIDQFNDNSPWKVSGVAIPVNTIVNGGQNVSHFFPPETLEDAGDLLEGVNIVKNFHDLEGQANADQVIGEVTNAGFQKGVGLVFEGEITDVDIAEKISHGFLDVSPSPARRLGEFDDDMGAQEVAQLTGFRDIAVVANGQPGAKVEMGPNPAVEALSMDALGRGFDTLQSDEKTVAGVTFTGTAEGELDESELDADEHTLADHYLYGDGEDKEDYSYPLVDAEMQLRRGNVDAAHQLGCRGQCPSDDTHDENLRQLASEFDNPPEWATGEQDSNESAESDVDTQSDDPHNGGDGESSVADGTETTTMSENDLSDEEKAVLRAAESIDEPTDALNAYAAAEQPEIVEQDVLNAKDEKIDELADVFREVLSDQKDLGEDTVAAMPVDALTAEFRNDDGEIEADVLSQTPETETSSGGGDGENGGVDTLSGEDKSEVQDLLRRADLLADRTPDHADTLRSKAADIAGVEDADEIEVDAL